MAGPRLDLGMDRFSGLYLWALLIVIFSLWIPQLFLNMVTFRSVASAQAVVAILAIAATISLASGAFDVSIGAVANLSTVVAVAMQTIYGWGMWQSIVLALLIGPIVGFVNGFVIVALKVNPVVATLGMGSVLLAVQEIVTRSSQPAPPSSETWMNLTLTPIFGVQVIVVYMIVIALVVWWATAHTPAGRHLYAVGSNPEAAKLSGVRVGRVQWLALIASSTICSIAGVLYASAYGPSLTYGASLLLPAFAAVFLGSTQLIPGRFNVWGTLIAVYVLATGVQGLQLVTGVSWLNQLFSGLALIVAVSLAGWRQRKVAEARRIDSAPPGKVGGDGPAGNRPDALSTSSASVPAN
ncbi:ABC transporter permease [Rhodococcus aetherivorans]|uniref:ABC transporter permease n=1 Tax=Rhodococcus aetherivorans TaxID=191292 RepID=UPI003685A4F1